ncbi:RWD domain [Branchiostoma belcheri]|nr:RWD domain [Branchiostoma belcheri]
MPKEDQEEELEVLKSIYESDECFKEVNSTTFQYRIGEEGEGMSFLLEVSWGEDYPEATPNMSLDAFYNNHIHREIKDDILQRLGEQAEENLGLAMTFTLIEWAKENREDLMAKQLQILENKRIEGETKAQESPERQVDQGGGNKKEKKEQLTKAQKRRIADRTDHRGERPRGWDWVDVVKHLSKTGGGKQDG